MGQEVRQLGTQSLVGPDGVFLSAEANPLPPPPTPHPISPEGSKEMEGQEPETSLEEEASSSWSGPGNHACGHVQQHWVAPGPAFWESWS